MSTSADNERSEGPKMKTNVDGVDCHVSRDQLRATAAAAGKKNVLDRYAEDYPMGPHDQPQSMCPAFGSLRVGLRMRRTATILSGSACCVYGLTFTSHFYGARRTVGYVPFDSETLVTGKLFEDIRDAVHATADPEKYDAIIVTNLCVPTASGVPLRLLPQNINGVRIIGIDVPGFGVPTHAEAKDVLAGAMLAYARSEAEQGPVAALVAGVMRGRPSRWSGRCFLPIPWSLESSSSRSGLRRGQSYRRASGANSTRPSTVRPSLRSILFIRQCCVSSVQRDGRSSGRRQSGAKERSHGFRLWATHSTSHPLRLTRSRMR